MALNSINTELLDVILPLDFSVISNNFVLDCVDTMQALFENGERVDGSNIWASVYKMPKHFENSRKFDGKNSLQDFDAKEIYRHPKNRSVSFQKCQQFSFSSVHTIPFPACSG